MRYCISCCIRFTLLCVEQLEQRHYYLLINWFVELGSYGPCAILLSIGRKLPIEI